MSHGKRIVLVALVAVVVVFAGREAGTATASQDVPTSHRAAWVAQLASATFAEREEAMAKLLADRSLTVEAVAELYAAAEHAEQRARLLRVAQHVHLRAIAAEDGRFPEQIPGAGPFGAMGIPQDAVVAGHAPGLTQPAVRVCARFSGFPSLESLRRDDLLLALNGQRLSRNPNTLLIFDDFMKIVKSHKPGETIRVTVLRDGKTVDVNLTLANADALNGMYEMGGEYKTTPYLTPTLAREWQQRQADLFQPIGDEPLVVDWP